MSRQLMAFSTLSFLLGLSTTGLADAIGVAPLLPVALIVGGFVQVTLAVSEVFRGGGLAATVLGGAGPFWISYGLVEGVLAARVTDGSGSAALTSGLTMSLSLFTALAVVVLVASLRTDILLVTVFGLLVVALALLVVGVGSGDPGPAHVSGHLMLALGVLGWFRGAAGVLSGRSVLPTGPLARPPA